jgi:hypothetical protein
MVGFLNKLKIIYYLRKKTFKNIEQFKNNLSLYQFCFSIYHFFLKLLPRFLLLNNFSGNTIKKGVLRGACVCVI